MSMDWSAPSFAPDCSRRVLIIDDDRDFADSLRNLLTLDGYEVEVAYSAAGAFDMFDRFEVEVALIDIRLGERDGLALVGELRQRREDVIYVMVTAYASVEIAIEALQRGAYDFLCKPFYPEQLIAVLERCFERIALARRREAAERALSIRNQELESVNARLKRAVSAMQALSTSMTLPSLYTTALEMLAHVMGASNAALYFAEGEELVLHEALVAGMPPRMPAPGGTRALEHPMLALRASGSEAATDSSRSQSLLAFPLAGDGDGSLGLLVLEADASFSDQDRELGAILASFINEGIRMLQALDIAHWSETRLREIIDNSPSLIALNDLDDRYLMVNRQFEAWHGRTADDVKGRRPDEVLPSNIARLYQTRAAASIDDNSTIEKITEEETEIVFQDGSAHTVLVTRFPIRGADRQSIGIGTIATDLTERRYAERRLRHSQQMEALGQLTGGIAHDFNNLLTVIIGNLDLLREQIHGRSAPRELVDDALSSAASGRELVQSLLAFGRRQRLQPEPADANEIVLGLSRVIERTLSGRFEIRWALTNDLWPIAVDKSQFETGLLNLVLNARDAMPRGGFLTVETRNIVVREPFGEHEAVAPGSYVALAVSDNGIGMTPLVAAQALQPFFTTKEAGTGNGLGLSMVYGFVKQSGGYLVMDSKPGSGTTVTLYFPRAKDSPPRPQTAAADQIDQSVRGERILVVEDQSAVRKMARSMLTSLGYVVLDAEDGTKALALLQQQPTVDLLLTDIMLTGPLNGFELASEATRLRPALKVAFMSGYAEAALPRRTLFRGAGLVIDKPFTREALAAKIRQALAGTA
jgi:PAS domain S-box-containing protein